MKIYTYLILTLFLFTTVGFSQITNSDIESSTHLLRGGLSDKDGKNISYNKSFTAPDGFVLRQSGGSYSSSGFYNNLESHTLNITNSKKSEALVVKRRVSKSWSKEVVNTYLSKQAPNDLKLSFSTKGRVVLKGNAKASLNLKLQLGNRHSGFIFKTARYEFRPMKSDPSRIEIFDKNKIVVSTVPNGGEFDFSYTDHSFRTFIGEKEAVFTISADVETSAVSNLESYAFLKTDSMYDLIK